MSFFIHRSSSLRHFRPITQNVIVRVMVTDSVVISMLNKTVQVQNQTVNGVSSPVHMGKINSLTPRVTSGRLHRQWGNLVHCIQKSNVCLSSIKK